MRRAVRSYSSICRTAISDLSPRLALLHCFAIVSQMPANGTRMSTPVPTATNADMRALRLHFSEGHLLADQDTAKADARAFQKSPVYTLRSVAQGMRFWHGPRRF